MTTMTVTHANTGPEPTPWDQGYFDGEIAAIEGLSSRRAHARASMADQHDPDYAQGYIDGYLHTIAVTHARATQQ